MCGSLSRSSGFVGKAHLSIHLSFVLQVIKLRVYIIVCRILNNIQSCRCRNLSTSLLTKEQFPSVDINYWDFNKFVVMRPVWVQYTSWQQALDLLGTAKLSIISML